MNVEMCNGNILCQEKKQELNKNQLILPNEKSYKIVTMINGENKGKDAYVLKHVGTDMELEKEQYVVIHERDIILII